MEMGDGDVAEPDHEGAAHNPRRPVRRPPPAPDKAASDQLQWQITECLGKQHPIYKEWVKIQMCFRDDLMRRGVEQAGPGVKNRIRAFWEPAKKQSRVENSAENSAKITSSRGSAASAARPLSAIATIATATATTATPWVEMPNYKDKSPLTQNYVLQKVSQNVASVPFSVLHDAMKNASVPGAVHAQNKDALIELMAKYNCKFNALPTPVIYNGNKTPAASQSQEIQNRLLGLTGKRARDYLQQTGPTVDDIVEIHPDVKARRAGQRWFMIVKKAKMITVEGKECIESCRWCQTNTLQPCTIWKEGTLCRLENVRAYGVRDAPIFKDLVTVHTAVPQSVVLAKVAQLNQLVAAAKDAESSSSDSDAPISKGAIAMAKASAEAAKIPRDVRLQ
jgi:hypothetical protein